MPILLSGTRSKSLGQLLCKLIKIRFRYSSCCSWAGWTWFCWGLRLSLILDVLSQAGPISILSIILLHYPEHFILPIRLITISGTQIVQLIEILISWRAIVCVLFGIMMLGHQVLGSVIQSFRRLLGLFAFPLAELSDLDRCLWPLMINCNLFPVP